MAAKLAAGRVSLFAAWPDAELPGVRIMLEDDALQNHVTISTPGQQCLHGKFGGGKRVQDFVTPPILDRNSAFGIVLERENAGQLGGWEGHGSGLRNDTNCSSGGPSGNGDSPPKKEVVRPERHHRPVLMEQVLFSTFPQDGSMMIGSGERSARERWLWPTCIHALRGCWRDS